MGDLLIRDVSSDEARRLALAEAAARACGVTRVGDITGLDRVGIPVFHAIRPLSRALVTHQGKGFTPGGARLGALMEAVESARAEAFDAPVALAAWRDLPPERRFADLGDFAFLREDPVGVDEPLRWVEGVRLTDGGGILVPFDCVSLDCVAPWDVRLDHTSNGLAARFDYEGAALKGLLEVIERDAIAEWRELSLPFRALQSIDEETIGFPWLGAVSEALARANVELSLYSLPTIIGLPAVAAEVFERDALPSASARAIGCACAPTAAEALEGAVLEALQCRLTTIAGARDDILYGRDVSLTEGFPLPPDLDGLTWEEVCEDDVANAQVTPAWIAERLAEEGYPNAATVQVSAADDPVVVVKAFAPGLAAFRRSRRSLD